MIKTNKFEYFLNAVHYSLWIADKKHGDFAEKVVKKFLSPIPKYLFTEKYKKKYEERLLKAQKVHDSFFYDKETGFHIGWANHWFGYFYSGYSIFISFILAGFAIKEIGDLNAAIIIVILVIPIGLCYIPAYKAVFSNDKYLKYFKQFEKEDKYWHRKWKRRTIAFCIGSVVTTILGICSISLIVIVL
jgi:amino acid transporter